MSSPHPAGHEVIGVDVPGGRLAVETHPSGTEPILAIHGVSSQRRLWNWLRAADPGLRLVAPDALVAIRPLAGADHAASIMTLTGARATAELIAEAQS